MGYTNEQLHNMSYDELKNISTDDMLEMPPVRSLGFNHVVCYSCKNCNERLEGSERRVKMNSNPKPVICPYCGEMLWDPAGKNCLRKSAFKPGHFDTERKKRYLKYLKDQAKRK